MGVVIPKLVKLDIEQPRTQSELRAWIDKFHREFGQTKEGKRAIRLKAGALVKQFKEEIWPLGLFADAFYNGRTDLFFQNVIGNQSYDALIVHANGRVLHHLQITQALDGHQDNLRMLHLETYGRAPITGVKLQRDKSRRVPETWPEAESHEKLLKQVFERIRSSVQLKSLMRYERNTSLILEFEDNHLDSEGDRQALDEFARCSLLPIAGNYAALYLVSSHHRHAFQYKN